MREGKSAKLPRGGVGKSSRIRCGAESGKNEDRVGRSRNEDRVCHRQSVEQADHSQQRWQPLGDGRWGRVVGREGAER
jgi:hypothetical protein